MDPVTLAKHEFLLDRADYFSDKQPLYLNIKSMICETISVDISDIKICGSAYWGRRFRDETPFEPGVSDLDVALISPLLFCRSMTEVRECTKNFTDQTPFPKSTRSISSYQEFQDYAFKKGIIRIDHLPDIKTRREMRAASDFVSKEFVNHFEKITFSIYDSAISFAVKQATAAKKFRD